MLVQNPPKRVFRLAHTQTLALAIHDIFSLNAATPPRVERLTVDLRLLWMLHVSLSSPHSCHRFSITKQREQRISSFMPSQNHTADAQTQHPHLIVYLIFVLEFFGVETYLQHVSLFNAASK